MSTRASSPVSSATPTWNWSTARRRWPPSSFADFANFTGISERLTPGALVKLINRYLALMSGPVTEHHGLIDKYIGDAIMAFWVPPFCADGDQATLAVQVTLDESP